MPLRALQRPCYSFAVSRTQTGFAFAGVSALALFFGYEAFFAHGFTDAVSRCNAVEQALRFSCYRSAIEDTFVERPDDFSAFLAGEPDLRFEYASENGVEYAVFGTNCHTFYHAAGDFVATHLGGKDLSELIGIGQTRCTNGYIMGLFKRLALAGGFETDLLKQFWEACKADGRNQCAHEIGHLLHDKHTYSILRILDTLSDQEYGLKYPRAYAYVTYENADLNAPFEECKEIIPDADKVAQCFTGIGHNLFLFSEFSKDGNREMLRQCSVADTEYLDICLSFAFYRIGINEAAPRFLSDAADEGNAVCEEVANLSKRPDLVSHCYLGVGGGIGLFLDSEYGHREVAPEGLVRLKKELMAHTQLCESAPVGYVEKCLAGLMGTRYAKFYESYGLYHPTIEALLPSLDSDFEVVQ